MKYADETVFIRAISSIGAIGVWVLSSDKPKQFAFFEQFCSNSQATHENTLQSACVCSLCGFVECENY